MLCYHLRDKFFLRFGLKNLQSAFGQIRIGQIADFVRTGNARKLPNIKGENLRGGFELRESSPPNQNPRQ